MTTMLPEKTIIENTISATMKIVREGEPTIMPKKKTTTMQELRTVQEKEESTTVKKSTMVQESKTLQGEESTTTQKKESMTSTMMPNEESKTTVPKQETMKAPITPMMIPTVVTLLTTLKKEMNTKTPGNLTTKSGSNIHGFDQFFCLNGVTLNLEKFCDGINDCGDYSDETFGCNKVSLYIYIFFNSLVLNVQASLKLVNLKFME